MYIRYAPDRKIERVRGRETPSETHRVNKKLLQEKVT